nr:MAG TPA: hypothetical protein [Caudoviricetes sp.]
MKSKTRIPYQPIGEQISGPAMVHHERLIAGVVYQTHLLFSFCLSIFSLGFLDTIINYHPLIINLKHHRYSNKSHQKEWRQKQ